MKINKTIAKKVLQGTYWFLLGLLLLIIIITTASALNIPSGFKLYTVQSGSMKPTIPLYSLILVQPQNNYQVDDIITYKKPEDKNNPKPKITITHRIIEVKDNQFTIKGDANDAPDSQPTSLDLILGKVIFTIPLIGKPVAFAKTQTGFILLIVIPATIIVYSEIVSIKNQIQLIKAKKKK